MRSGSARGTLNGNNDGVRDPVERLIFLNLETSANGLVAKRRKHTGDEWVGERGVSTNVRKHIPGLRISKHSSKQFRNRGGARGYNISPQN